MKSYRIVLTYSNTTYPNTYISPADWDWFDLIAPESYETMTLEEVIEIPTPQAHIDDFNDRNVHND